MDEALALDARFRTRPFPAASSGLLPSAGVGVALDEARGLLLHLLDAARRRQDAATEAFALRSLASSMAGGNSAEADRHAAGGIEL